MYVNLIKKKRLKDFDHIESASVKLLD